MSSWRKAFCVVASSALLCQIAPAISEEKFSFENYVDARPGSAKYSAILLSCQAYGMVDRKTNIFFDSSEDYNYYANKYLMEYGKREIEKIASSGEIHDFVNFLDSKPAKFVDDYCRPKLRGFIASKAIQQNSSIANAKKSDSDAHQQCLDAKDYQGCMKFATGQSQGSPDEDCPPDEWCTATKGIDPLGKQKIVGWEMRYEPGARRVTYRRLTPQKVNVRGATDRYFEFELVVREEKDAVAAIASKTTSYGSATTNCTGYGSSIHCSTNSAPSITMPGRTGRAGGVYSYTALALFDCEERTWGLHLDGRLHGKWKKVTPSTRQSYTLDEYCPIINTFKTSSFTKYVND